MKYDYLVSLNSKPNKPHYRRPIVELEIFGPKTSVKTNALVDSGADYCLINLEFAKYLGIDLTKCDIEKTTGVEGGVKELFMSEIEIQIKHLNKIKIPVGFIESGSVSVLLGQVGFFDNNRIKFERDHNKFEIIPIS